MIVRSITGEDEINDLLTGAMTATIGTLVKEHCLTEKQGYSFLDHHLCMLAPADGGFKSWFKRMWPGFKEAKILVAVV